MKIIIELWNKFVSLPPDKQARTGILLVCGFIILIILLSNLFFL